MGRTSKIAISLPENLLKEVEREREQSGESRSEFFRRAVEKLLKQEREAEADRNYIRAYREMPETEEEIEAMDKIGRETLAQEKWE